MKKLLITTCLFLGTFSMASAELGINIGVSGQSGYFEATANESVDAAKQESEEAAGIFGYGSIFIEKTLGRFITVGYDHVPGGLSSESFEETREDETLAGAKADQVQTGSADFDNLNTYYIALNITENFYVKAGQMSVDVTTNETLASGAIYGNKTLDGTTLGGGYHKSFDNGFFYRAEGTVFEIDGHTFVSSKALETGNTRATQVRLEGIDGVSAKFSIGKSF